MYLPFGEGRHAPVAAEDIVRVVVGICPPSGTNGRDRLRRHDRQSGRRAKRAPARLSGGWLSAEFPYESD